MLLVPGAAHLTIHTSHYCLPRAPTPSQATDIFTLYDISSAKTMNYIEFSYFLTGFAVKTIDCVVLAAALCLAGAAQCAHLLNNSGSEAAVVTIPPVY